MQQGDWHASVPTSVAISDPGALVEIISLLPTLVQAQSPRSRVRRPESQLNLDESACSHGDLDNSGLGSND